jgi:hypothetical protein
MPHWYLRSPLHDQGNLIRRDSTRCDFRRLRERVRTCDGERVRSRGAIDAAIVARSWRIVFWLKGLIFFCFVLKGLFFVVESLREAQKY